MSRTPDLGIPLVVAGQYQQEIPHNLALVMLQALLTGAEAITNDPPASPTAGDTYIVSTVPTGLWVGHANKIAVYYGGSWRFVPDVDSNGTNITMGDRQAGLSIYCRDVGAGSPTVGGLMRWMGSGLGWVVV